MATRSLVCEPWATIADVCSPCDDYTFDTGVLEDGLAVASDVLYLLTRQRWPGECRETVYPEVGASLAGAQANAQAVGGTLGAGFRTGGYPVWPRRFACLASDRIKLPGYPVVAVHEVVVDGLVLDVSAYRVEDGRYLRRIDGDGWPGAPSDDWHVDYSYGLAPPLGGIKAAAALGCQLALACNPEAVNSGKCRLPKRVTTITRQGVSLAVLDPLTLFDGGKTGLPEVDLWVAAVLRGDRNRRATVIDPAQAAPSVRRRS